MLGKLLLVELLFPPLPHEISGAARNNERAAVHCRIHELPAFVVEPRPLCGPAFVLGHMGTFRILYFRESVLERSEEIEVRDVLEAIDRATGKPTHLRAEVWSDRGRVAEVGTAPQG